MASVNNYYNFVNGGVPVVPALGVAAPDPNAWMWGALVPEPPVAGPPPPPPQDPAAAAPPPLWAAILGNGNPPLAAAPAPPPAPPPAPVIPQGNAPPPPPPAPAMPVMQPQGASQWAAIQGPVDAAPIAGPDWFISPAQGGLLAPAPMVAPQNMGGFYM